jgi:hypothetical protein
MISRALAQPIDETLVRPTGLPTWTPAPRVLAGKAQCAKFNRNVELQPSEARVGGPRSGWSETFVRWITYPRAVRDIAELVKDGWKIRLLPAGRHLSETKFKATTAAPKGVIKQTSYGDVAECRRALAERVAALVADGWTDTGIGHAKKRPAPATKATATANTRAPASSAKALDAKFGVLAKRTIAALGRSTTVAADEKIWRAAAAKYGALKVAAGGGRTEHLVHFFAVDGIALDAAHPVVVACAKGTAARKERWTALLVALAKG